MVIGVIVIRTAPRPPRHSDPFRSELLAPPVWWISRLQAPGLRRVHREGAGAAEGAGASLLQDLGRHMGFDVSGDGPIMAWRVSSVDGPPSPPPPLSKGRSPGFREIEIARVCWSVEWSSLSTDGSLS